MQINAHSFITAVKAVLPFAGVNDVRHYLNGVHIFSTADDGLTIEATDGHTAAQVTLDGAYGGTEIILDRVTASQIAKLKVKKVERGTAVLSWTARDGILFNDEYGANAAYMERAFKSAGLLAHPKYHGVKMYAGGCYDAILLEVPTDHGDFTAISKPALFTVLTMRI